MTMAIAPVVILAVFGAGVALVWRGLPGRARVGVAMIIASLAALVVYSAVLWHWIAADSRARVISRECGVEYTREDVFFAADVIEQVCELGAAK